MPLWNFNLLLCCGSSIPAAGFTQCFGYIKLGACGHPNEILLLDVQQVMSPLFFPGSLRTGLTGFEPFKLQLAKLQLVKLQVVSAAPATTPQRSHDDSIRFPVL